MFRKWKAKRSLGLKIKTILTIIIKIIITITIIVIIIITKDRTGRNHGLVKGTRAIQIIIKVIKVITRIIKIIIRIIRIITLINKEIPGIGMLTSKELQTNKFLKAI